MFEQYNICEGRVTDTGGSQGNILVYSAPDEAERRTLIDAYKLDEHTLNCALDPNEPARMEFEPEHVAMIIKHPKNYSSEDNFLFKVVSVGIYLFKDKLIIVTADKVSLFDGRRGSKITSLNDAVLRLFYRSIFHFEEHLKVINEISNEIEQEVNTAMSNKHLLNMFTLEKSLVYYINAIMSNAMVIDKLKVNFAKIGFTPDNLETLDDTIIENNQCLQQAQIYSNILASLMDARASIVANNLNVLMKNLNIIMIALMLPTLIVSIFSMNLELPVVHHLGHMAFWFVMSLALASVFLVYYVVRKNNR